MTMLTVSAGVLAAVERAEGRLRALSEEEARRPALAGGWSRKELLGHLVDSASNNHQRLVRAALAGELVFPGYETDKSVRVQAVLDVDWPLLVGLWASYNRYLAHVIGRLPEDRLGAICRIGEREPVTLAFLVEDYLRHLEHHLGQIGLGAK